MSRNAITVENLSKAYRIGLKQERADSLIGLAQQTLSAPFRNFRQLRRLDTLQHQDEAPDLFWALKDVSFEVPEGEVLGVIGRNGAGKSTLLKVLSRITEPTAGRAVIRGRVASLLEVGTGFHPELSGRDNIYMNGTILGMTKREIDRKLDQIVDFSGVEKFLDTPVKRYSSGMRVRLGFAVAAHLDPEILIVDEVLAVGDAEFQKKCLGKMQDVARGGRTVLFVSHNMAAVRMLCHHGIVIDHGKVAVDAPIDEAIASYSQSSFDRASDHVLARTDRGGSGRARLIGLEIRGQEDVSIVTGGPLSFHFVIQSNLREVQCIFTVYDIHGDALLSCSSAPWTEEDTIDDPEGQRLICALPECPFLEGDYRINVAIHSGGDRLDHLEGAASFSVAPGFMRTRPTGRRHSFSRFSAPHSWRRTSE